MNDHEAARPATRDDAADLVDLARLAITEVEPVRGGARHLAEVLGSSDHRAMGGIIDDGRHLVIAGTYAGATVGFGVARLDAHGVLDVVGLFVHPGARCVGVGEAMMDLLTDQAVRLGASGIDACALPGDRATKNFFETFGLVARKIVVHRAVRRPES